MNRLLMWMATAPGLVSAWTAPLRAQAGATPRATAAAVVPALPSPAPYAFHIERGWLRMHDGVRLAVTYFRPVPRTPAERFPVLLQYLPYRKEDSSYPGVYSEFSWFVRRGYIMAQVDIRGTGSSEGHLPPREYSDEEMQDAGDVIAQLAALPGSNGSVGMWGISWGGFNSIQIAMHRPPALKAIIAADATDDLYHDDVHYIDGVLHVDQYMLEIDHENGLPATPAYALDSAYFTNRFDAYPWLLTYLHHAQDDDWWRSKSLRFHFGAIDIPCFLIGGLLDGYRDAIPRMLDSVHAPIRAEIGPWEHAWPDNGTPGPNREWREEALLWWDHWLKGRDNGVMNAPRLILFERAGNPPDANLTMTPGEWRYEDWPIARTTPQQWFLGDAHNLVPHVEDAGSTRQQPNAGAGEREAPAAAVHTDLLTYVAGAGTAAPVWWGDPTGNMAADDGNSLVYDSPPVTTATAIAGFPSVRLRVSSPVPVADWTVRLEDVAPGGLVSLVTGTLISGAQRTSRLAPSPLPVDSVVTLAADLHFTTWAFQPGHRIRLAIANAQFPMAWPTPFEMTTRLMTGDAVRPGTLGAGSEGVRPGMLDAGSGAGSGAAGSMLSLPVTPPDPAPRTPPVLPPEHHEHAPDVRTVDAGRYPGAVVTHDALANTTAVDFLNHYAHTMGGRYIEVTEKEHYDTHDDHPSRSHFLGDEVHVIRMPDGRTIRLHTIIGMQSDSSAFHVTFTRRIDQNGKTIRTKTWTETLPRGNN